MEIKDILTICLGTGVIGATVKQWFDNRHQASIRRDDRRRQFIVFLCQWRSQLRRIPHTDPQQVWDHYLTKVHDYYAEAARVYRDFDGQAFWAAVERLGDFEYPQVAGDRRDMGDPRKPIAHTIQELVSDARRQSNDA